ncbi:replication initiation protein [Lysinibacillus endophyticus]|uniref:RepB family plasmid replication initiator protein n=1 Tax=Ureibacillus endophyticus TaxID=1978490 RepID=A0A494YR77_9BACL|nr:replication initiation protein [Lysinibacillus endophyticus]MCP1146823.1 replication initiation protein [Lysinibacillus endophyticus]RKQ11649.1 RepB family plasmid replication initiator protein [Lysinibacillus endophyticus]
MVRKNEKKKIISYENSILKSNEISMAKLNKGLTLNQMQLLAYAIYSTQQSGNTEFHKADFERKFNIEKYQTIHAKEDAQKLLALQFSIEDLENDYFEYWNVFGSIKYKEGLFTFRWNEDFVPHILELKEKYITTDLTITSQFKSGFSWILYDYLKAHYGYWHKPISKDALMRLFGVEDVKSYSNNTGLFKKKVLDMAIAEINQYTELQVTYKELKQGRAIIGFDLHWSNGSTSISATQKQINELKIIIDAVFVDALKYIDINNQQSRERAIKLVRELEGYRQYTDKPICITKERADFLLVKCNTILKELENLKEQDHNKPSLYNWLEERE